MRLLCQEELCHSELGLIVDDEAHIKYCLEVWLKECTHFFFQLFYKF